MAVSEARIDGLNKDFTAMRERVKSDVDSEKETRARANAHMEQKIEGLGAEVMDEMKALENRTRALEAKLFFAGGALAALQLVVIIMEIAKYTKGP